MKAGRNDPCPCGSGKKYKKCHLDADARTARTPLTHPVSTELIVSRAQAREVQRTRQQGRGRPIISTEFAARRVVAVGSRVLSSARWRTMHDFLLDYPTHVFGRAWFAQQLRESSPHSLIGWYRLLRKHQQAHTKAERDIQEAPMIGAAEAYLRLSYNLYLLEHNSAGLHARLIERLRHVDQFRGASYETHVAAALIRAGFDVAPEDEQDASSSHCEFTATHRGTGQSFSIEAKARQPGKTTVNVRNQLHEALRKRALHARIVFIEVNMPDGGEAKAEVAWLEECLVSVRSAASMTVDRKPTDPAYVIVTNHPIEYNLERSEYRTLLAAEGFKIPDFGTAAKFASLREARLARERHRAVHDLLTSFREHHSIPTTFDGEIPDLAFGENPPRLLIGNRYSFPDATGTERPAVLTHATVNDRDGTAMCAVRFDDGANLLVSVPLTAKEVAAYRRHPDTFFGVADQNGRSLTEPLDLYDWLFRSYGKSSREQLLALLGTAAARPDVAAMSQRELAELYCEGLVTTILRRSPDKGGDSRAAPTPE